MDQTLWSIILSILSFVLAAISVWIAITTMRQNNRMLEEATRPALSLILLWDGSLDFFLKNTGKTDAIIKTIEHSIKFEETHGFFPFKNCEGAVIAPGEYLHYACDYNRFCKDNEDVVNVKIKYKSQIGKEYLLDQDYSIVALRMQTFSLTKITEDNSAIVQANALQKLQKQQRVR